jgi:hypothetical protein
MSLTTTMTVPVSGAPTEVLPSNPGGPGCGKTGTDDDRDLIRRDRLRAGAFDRVKAELTRAFAAPQDSYRPLTAAQVIARNRG